MTDVTPANAARIGIGGPVGSGKTALIERLIPVLQARGVDLAVITNDLVTKEDAERLRRSGLIDPSRVEAVEAGACPHTVIREDPTLNIAAGDALEARFPGLQLLVFESGGDNLASTFSLDLVDWWIFVIDVAGGDDIPRKRGPGVLRCDLLVINKIDLAPHVGVDLEGMLAEAARVRGGKPVIATNARAGLGIDRVADAIGRAVLFTPLAVPDDIQTGRRATARLGFVRGGGTSVLADQHVPYPFHITKPFRLYPQRPELITLYLQSASGGLYRGDRLGLDIAMGPGSAAHVTTQAATVVHRSADRPARQDTRIRVAADAFLHCVPDPLILFPGAALSATTQITLEPGARAVVSESIACHDPEGRGRPFDRVELGLGIETAAGAVLVRERARIAGAEFDAPDSPLGPWRAYGAMVILGPAPCLPDPGDVQAAADRTGCRAGLSPLPNAAGLGLRLLAPDGGTLAAGLEAAAGRAFAALTGLAPARRRK